MLGREPIVPGDLIITCRENGFRSNGFSLVRHIIKESTGGSDKGRDAFLSTKVPNSDTTYGEAIITPSKIYSAAVLSLIGRFADRGRAPPVRYLSRVVHLSLACNFFCYCEDCGRDGPRDTPLEEGPDRDIASDEAI